MFCFNKARREKSVATLILVSRRGLAEIISGQGSEEITMPSVCPGVRVNAHKCLEEFPCPWPHRTPSHPPLQPFFVHSHIASCSCRGWKASGCSSSKALRSHLLPSSLGPWLREGEYSFQSLFIVVQGNHLALDDSCKSWV